jgi:hypothetical protein
MDDEKFKLKKADELIALRTSIIHVLIVLVGGTIGLFFTENLTLKVILIPLGFFYFCVVVLNLIDITEKLDKLLGLKKEGK